MADLDKDGIEHSESECPFEPQQVRDSTIMAANGFTLIANIAPILRGHSLVIPRRHVASLLDLSDEEITGFFLFARQATEMLVKVLGADGFNWSLQDGVPAGQTVGHLHVHIIPRYDGDLPDPGDWYPKLQAEITESGSANIDSDEREKLSSDELRAVAAAIRDRAVSLGLISSDMAGPEST